MANPQDSKPALPACDGIVRSIEQDRQIDQLVAAAFADAAGREALAYLRSITINRVAGPEISDAALRHLEGQRSLVAIIETRIMQHDRHQRAATRPKPDASELGLTALAAERRRGRNAARDPN